MGKFAKLFDIGDEQVLVITELSYKEYPQVTFISEINGTESKLHAEFAPKNGKEKTIDELWESAMKMFNNIDLEKAKHARAFLEEQYNESLLGSNQ